MYPHTQNQTVLDEITLTNIPDIEVDGKSNDYVIAPGVYEFKVKNAEFSKSKEDKPMIKILITVKVQTMDLGNQPSYQGVFDYLSLQENMYWKLKHFLLSIGMADAWEKRKFKISDLIDKKGRVRIINKVSPEYGNQSKVKDYIVLESKSSKPSEGMSNFTDSDIPDFA